MVHRIGFVFVLVIASSVLAQTGPELLLKPNLSEEEVWESRGSAYFLDNGSTSNDAQLKLDVYEYEGRFREQRERLIPRIGWEITHLSIDSNDPFLQKDLTDVSIAAGVELGKYYDWQGGLTVGVGYAGDTPFGEGDAWYGMATLVFGKKVDEQTDMVFVVDYNGNRNYYPDIPLPGFAYRHEFDPKLTYVVGVPVSSVTWKPTDLWTIQATWTLVDIFDARAEYALAPKWTLFGALEARHKAFHVEGLQGHDRLLFEQRRAEVGLLWKPWEHTSFQVAGGYAFGGEFSTGWDQRDTDLVADISDEPYFRVGFERRF